MSEVDDVIKGFNAAMVRVDERRKAKEPLEKTTKRHEKQPKVY